MTVTGRARRCSLAGDSGPGPAAACLPQYRQVDQDWDEAPAGEQTGRPYWQLAPEPTTSGGAACARPPRGTTPGIGRHARHRSRVWSCCWWASGLWFLGHRNSKPQSASQPSHSAVLIGGKFGDGPQGRPARTGSTRSAAPADDPGNENDQLAGLAIDSNPSTSWNTQFYFNNPVFGGLKKGTGLILDMGKPVRLSSVQITFGSIPGADVQIEVGEQQQQGPPLPCPASARRQSHGRGRHAHLHHAQPGQGQICPGLVHQAAAESRVIGPVRGADLQHRRAGLALTAQPGDDPPDAELLRRHVSGDTEAFGILFSRHRERLWAVAVRTLGDVDDAADALQDAMISAFRRAGSFRGDSAVTTWLHRIVVNACLDLLRRQAARPALAGWRPRRWTLSRSRRTARRRRPTVTRRST
jgi:hypothetical protein